MATFTRTTVTNLRAEITDVNETLLKSGSDYCYRYGHRNGYHAFDLMRREEDGKLYTVAFIDGDKTPRQLIARLNSEYEFYLGRKVGDKR